MQDHIVRAMTKNGFVKAVAISSREITETARRMHKTLPTATAALGRLRDEGLISFRRSRFLLARDFQERL